MAVKAKAAHACFACGSGRQRDMRNECKSYRELTDVRALSKSWLPILDELLLWLWSCVAGKWGTAGWLLRREALSDDE